MLSSTFQFAKLQFFFQTLGVNKKNFSAIFLRPHCKVQPYRPVAIFLNQEFVELLICFFRVVDKDCRIADGLLHSRCSDIHGTPRKMVRICRPTNLPIQLRTTVSRIDNYRNSPPFGGVGGGCRAGGGCSLAQHFKPSAKAFEVRNRLMAWDIIHFWVRITLCELPERKVLGEFCITV